MHKRILVALCVGHVVLVGVGFGMLDYKRVCGKEFGDLKTQVRKGESEGLGAMLGVVSILLGLVYFGVNLGFVVGFRRLVVKVQAYWEEIGMPKPMMPLPQVQNQANKQKLNGKENKAQNGGVRNNNKGSMNDSVVVNLNGISNGLK